MEVLGKLGEEEDLASLAATPYGMRRPRLRGLAAASSIGGGSTKGTRKRSRSCLPPMGRLSPDRPDKKARISEDTEGLAIVSCRFICGADSGSVDPAQELSHPDEPPANLPRIKFGRSGAKEPDRYEPKVGKGVHSCWYCERTFSAKKSILHADRKEYQKRLAWDSKERDSFLEFRQELIRSKAGGRKKLNAKKKILKSKSVPILRFRNLTARAKDPHGPRRVPDKK